MRGMADGDREHTPYPILLLHLSFKNGGFFTQILYLLRQKYDTVLSGVARND